MARMARALSYRPVNSLKHVIDAVGTATNVNSTIDLAIQHDTPLTSTPNRVHTGSVVKAIFLKVDVSGRVAYSGTPNVYMYVFKNASNELSPPAVTAVGASAVRKFVIHQEMTMIGALSDGQFPRTMFKGVVVIPKKYQRFGDADKLQLVVAHVDATGTADFCVQCIYKEFF